MVLEDLQRIMNETKFDGTKKYILDVKCLPLWQIAGLHDSGDLFFEGEKAFAGIRAEETLRSVILAGEEALPTIRGWQDETGKLHIINALHLQFLFKFFQDCQNITPLLRRTLQRISINVTLISKRFEDGKFANLTNEEGGLAAVELGWFRE